MKWITGILTRKRIRSFSFLFILFLSGYILLSLWNRVEFDIQIYLNASWENTVRVQNVNFKLSPQNVCEVGNTKTVITIVHTARENYEARSLLRKTIGSVKIYKNWSVPVVFIIGASEGGRRTNLDKSLEKEFDQYNDLIFGDFEDTYRNLSYKHIAALQWANEFCPDAAFYLKTDDDYMVEMFQVVNLVSTIQREDFNYYCTCKKGWIPYRPKDKKFYATVEEFPGEVYPDFCNGLYIVRMETVKRILSVSQWVKYFTLEDVFVSGILREAWNFEQKKKMLAEGSSGNYEQIQIVSGKVSSHLNTKKSFIDSQVAKKRLIEIHTGRDPERTCELWRNILSAHDLQDQNSNPVCQKF